MFRKFRVVNKGLPDIKKLLISLWKPVFHDASTPLEFHAQAEAHPELVSGVPAAQHRSCLLYTSDAADE